MAMNKRAIQEGDEWARIYEFNIAVRVPPGSWLCLNVAQADTHAHYHTTLSPDAITVAVTKSAGFTWGNINLES